MEQTKTRQFRKPCGTHCFSDWGTLIGFIDHMDLRDQKDLAEYILLGFYETGWDIYFEDGELKVTKTEEL